MLLLFDIIYSSYSGMVLLIFRYSINIYIYIEEEIRRGVTDNIP